MMNIGENILKMRKEKGITQEQLADVLCISAGAISKWETAASIPDISMLPKIANFFGVSIDRLFDFTLTESDTPEDIIKKVKDLTIGFDYEASILTHSTIEPVFEVKEKISILTDACIKFPNHYELKVLLCAYKRLDASRNIKDPESYKQALREVLDELYAITKLNTDKEINDKCYNKISEIHIILQEYDKAIEAAKKYGIKNNLMVGYNDAMIRSLLAQNKKEEAETHIHNIIYGAITQLYTAFLHFSSIIGNEEKLKNTFLTLINFIKAFTDDSPGPFDLYLFTPYNVLAFLHLQLGEFDECVKSFEETYIHAEKFKIFSETKEITPDFIKLADKDKFCYNMPYDYKKHLLMTFTAFENLAGTQHENDEIVYKNYMALKKRDDFQKFVEKLNA
jgi:transcriptional regulator with XRE-family HTH domain